MSASEHILALLAAGIAPLPAVEAERNLQKQDRLALNLSGYLNAANSLLLAHPELHNELIEHPDFMTMRRIVRKFGL